MPEEKKNVQENKAKEYLTLDVKFCRRVFKGEDGREVNYIQAEATYEEESFRFKIADKDSRLFQYLMKVNGYPIVTVEEE